MNSEVTQSAPTPGVLEWFYGVLFRPRETFATWPVEQAQGAAGLAVLVVSAIGGYTAAGAGAGAVMLGFFTYLGWLVFVWFTLTAMLFVIARILRPQGEFLPLLAATGLSFLPGIFWGPLAALAGWGSLGLALSVVGRLVLFGWWIRLLLAALRGVTGLSTGQAVLALVVAEVTLAAIPWTLFSLGLMSLVLAFS